MNMQYISLAVSILNTIGLSLNFYGAYNLFYLRDKGLEKIDIGKVQIPSPDMLQGNEPTWTKNLKEALIWKRDSTPEEMFNRLNAKVDENERYNKQVLLKSEYYLGYIKMGFLLSLFSTLLQLVSVFCSSY